MSATDQRVSLRQCLPAAFLRTTHDGEADSDGTLVAQTKTPEADGGRHGLSEPSLGCLLASEYPKSNANPAGARDETEALRLTAGGDASGMSGEDGLDAVGEGDEDAEAQASD